MKSVAISSLLLSGAYAFPFVMNAEGVDSSLLQAEHQRVRRQQPGTGDGGAETCPFNAKHQPANPVTAQYPYNNAKDGKPGNGKGGYLVPDPNDAAHAFKAPNYSTDIRGPCPGLNVAANHQFLAHDGIVTFNELVDAQQNVYNVGYDLAVLLALLGLTLTDGDLATQKLSIGCDATSRTSVNPLLTGQEPGLSGHNKFEADSSLTRNDYFTHNGDNFKMNATLFSMMTESTGGLYNLQNLAKYRKERYDQSKVENPNFYFGPFSLLLFGAASFLYELMPSGPNYVPDIPTISSFFGAEQDSAGNWRFNGKERIPENWTNRITPYTIPDVGNQILSMYLLNPAQFGGNTAAGSFDVIDFSNLIKNGTISAGLDPKVTSCLLYQLITERVPSYLNSVVTPTVEGLSFILTKLSGTNFSNLGCPRPLTK